ncbi:hypothetical protein EI983_09300 [Roseovarius faecimaris]|uniref:Uncharacterized protein n=1 Tax=Roseovarius faecimaris TaxID=2494550 RepID=A0A6I6ISH4_9RHOB|nr:hypothetical protein EI983_09300 [Roseovarius faecimaris]
MSVLLNPWDIPSAGLNPTGPDQATTFAQDMSHAAFAEKHIPAPMPNDFAGDDRGQSRQEYGTRKEII